MAPESLFKKLQLRALLIYSEGAIIPEDILKAIARERLTGREVAGFAFPKGTRLGDEFARAWSEKM